MTRWQTTPGTRIPTDDPEVPSFLAAPSLAMRELRQRFLELAPTSVPVLLTGESGTGKEVLA